MKKLTVFAAVCMVFFAVGSACAQQFDGAFGLGTVTGTSITNADADHSLQSVTGGAYPVFSADFLMKNHFGVGGEVAWRGSRNLYQGSFPYRTILYDFNAVWAPPLGKRAAAEFQGGIGSESNRFYQGFLTCTSSLSCTDYTSSNHLLGHVGVGVRLYANHNIFVRPEAHFYFVRNNFEFAGPNVNRFGISIGYTLAPSQD